MDRKSSLLRQSTALRLDKKQSRVINKRLSRSSLQQHQLDKFKISTDKIKFCYRGGHNQYSFSKDLKLSNETGTRIGFKIKSNNPQNYQVMPSQDIIENGGKFQIKMRLFISTTNIQKYWLDKFMIEWGILDESSGITIYSQKAYLNVQVLADTSTIQNEQISKGIEQSSKQILFYRELIHKHKLKIEKIERIIMKKQEQPKPWTIGMATGVILAAISFTLGYLIF